MQWLNLLTLANSLTFQEILRTRGATTTTRQRLSQQTSTSSSLVSENSVHFLTRQQEISTKLWAIKTEAATINRIYLLILRNILRAALLLTKKSFGKPSLISHESMSSLTSKTFKSSSRMKNNKRPTRVEMKHLLKNSKQHWRDQTWGLKGH